MQADEVLHDTMRPQGAVSDDTRFRIRGRQPFMKWSKLDARRRPSRNLGMAAVATQAMAAAHFNVAETWVLPGTACRHALTGARTLAEARRAVERYDFPAQGAGLAALVEALGPDIAVRCSPVVPRTWTWFPFDMADRAVIAHGLEELAGAIRAAWLLVLDVPVIQRARASGITDTWYLAHASAAVLLQSADLHPGLFGRAWSPDGELGRLHAVVRCALGTATEDAPRWEWTIAADRTVVSRPSPSPADETPVIQAGALVIRLSSVLAQPCVADWTWDGQELTFLAARTTVVSPVVRVFSRRAICQLTPRALTPMASAVLTELLHDLAIDIDALLLGTRSLHVPEDVVQSRDGWLYVDQSFTRRVLAQAGLPRDLLEDVLLQRHEHAAPAGRTLLRLPRAARAAAAVRFAVPRFERWVGENTARLADFDIVPDAVVDADDGAALFRRLISFMRPLLLNLLLLLASSSFRTHDLRRSLARFGAERRLDEAVQAAADTAGLNPWTHVDRIAAQISDAQAAKAADALARGDPDEAMRILCTDMTVQRDMEAFMRAFSFFRTSVADVASPTLAERSSLLPAALLHARETGAADRVANARDPMAWLESLPNNGGVRLKREYRAFLRTAAMTEKAWFYAAKALSKARLLLLRIGDRLVANGRLAAATDIFLLEPGDVSRCGDLRPLAAERAHDVDSGASVPDVVVLEDMPRSVGEPGPQFRSPVCPATSSSSQEGAPTDSE